MRYKRIEGSEKLKTFIKPMLAELTEKPAFDDPQWVFEIKWDGYRAIAEVTKKGNRLYSRNGLSFAKAYATIFNALSKIKKEVILDGEIIVFDEHNRPSFQKLQNYSDTSGNPIRYYVFDCLYADGKDITSLPLLQRKAILKKILPPDDIICYCDHLEESGVEFFNQIKKLNMEGMIAKKANSLYSKGKRTSNWLKIKNVKTEEAIIVGFTSPKGQRTGFGSLLLAQYNKKKLTYIGNVGTGFTEKILKELYSKLRKLSTKDCPVWNPGKIGNDITWVDPVLVCNLKYTEKTTDGIVRHPVFQGLRIDKTPEEVIM
jgi:bifunctional non-homologous end joining protein LigD